MAWLLESYPGLRAFIPYILAVLLTIVVAVLLLMIVMGSHYDPVRHAYRNLPWEDWLWLHAGQIAQLALVAGAAAIATHALSLAGYFRNALSGIVDVHVRAELEKLNPTLNAIVETQLTGWTKTLRAVIDEIFLKDRLAEQQMSIEEVWRKVSQRVLLPGFVEKDEADTKFLRAIGNELQLLVKDRQQYYKDKMRRLYVVRLSEDGRTLIFWERSEYDIVPYDPESEVVVDMRFIPGPGRSVADYDVIQEKFEVDDKSKIEEFQHQPDSTEKHSTVCLKGRPRYRIVDVSVVNQPSSDPLLIIAPDHVCTWQELRVRCDDPRLTVHFEEVRTKNAFRLKQSKPSWTGNTTESEYACDRTLLPDQGFVLCVTRKPPEPVGTA